MASRPSTTMMRHRLFSVLFVALLTLIATPVFAQVPPGGGGGGGGGAGNDPGVGGIDIDANGVLRLQSTLDASGRLSQQRLQAARTSLNKDLQQPSELRKISLNRLEAEIKKLKAEGKPVPPEMKYLAGLNRITHVFFYPETNDIVIAGPAEGFYINAENRVVGMESGKATMQLDDLIVALRAYAPNSSPVRVISCSIDPTPEGLQRLRNAVADVQRNARPGDEQRIVEYFKQALGLHTVTIRGVSPKTHFARVLVEADYHMKLIGIGIEKPPVRITSFIEKAKPSTVSKNSLQRWYFQPKYDYVKVSEDRTAMQLDGGGVELVGEDERVSAGGQRTRTGGMNRASRVFTSSFTKMYDDLADQYPLYADLRNVIDMSVAAAFIHEMDFYGKSGWSMDLFGDESQFPVERYAAPQRVEPVINAVRKNGLLMTPIGGGVNIQPRVALNSDRIKVDQDGEIQKTKESINLDQLADGQWWWD